MKEVLKGAILSLCCLGLWSGVYGQAQEIPPNPTTEIRGLPRITHYGIEDFKSDPQIFAMGEDHDGIKYFGNNDGLLIYDGARWQQLTLPNNSLVKAIHVATDGQVYVGGFNEFGVVHRDVAGQFSYQSRTSLLRPEEMKLEILQAVHEVQGRILFHSYSKLVVLDEQKAATVPIEAQYFSAVVNDQLYLADWGEGIRRLDMNTMELQLVVAARAYDWSPVSAILPAAHPAQLTVITRRGDVFALNQETGEMVLKAQLFEAGSANQVLSAIRTRTGAYYVGTLTSQVLMLDADGQSIPVDPDYFSLQDKTVMRLFESTEGNVWALLNNGIDCINTSAPASVLLESASVFDVLIHQDKMYVATNQGVFVSNSLADRSAFAGINFTPIARLEGQAWTLHGQGSEVICSMEKGLFVVSSSGVRQIPGTDGIWKVLPVPQQEGLFLVCTYYGMYTLRLANGDYSLSKMIPGFGESSRDIQADAEEGVYWICHGFKGVFRVKFDKAYSKVLSVAHYSENGLPSPYRINVSRWNDTLIFTTNAGIYTFDEPSGAFVPHHTLNEILGTHTNIRRVVQHGPRTWVVHEDGIGYFEAENPQLQKALFQETKGTLNKWMECIVPIGDQVLIGTKTGLYAYQLTADSTHTGYPTLLTSVSVADGSERKYLPLQIPDRLRLTADAARELRLEYAVPRRSAQYPVEYSYRLLGMEADWSGWSIQPVREYTQLSPGTYTFQVKARTRIGEQMQPATYTFQILPAWYQSVWAYAAYVLAGLGLLWLAIRLIRRKIAREKALTREEERERQKVLELELQQMKLEREKLQIVSAKEMLEADLITKSKELVNYTMLLVNKRELLTELKEDLVALKEGVKNEKNRQIIRDMSRKIGLNLNDEKHIQIFETNFERIHHEFFTELKAQYPDLTSKELRLCALVKMNLTNKEIAPILNISVRGVETARYRLRSRLGIHENMVEFLEKLSGNEAGGNE